MFSVSPKKHFIKCFLAIVLSCAMLFCIFGCSPDNTAEVPPEQLDGDKPVPDTEDVGGDPVTRFLVLGRDRKVGLTDTVFLVSVRESSGDVRILQIPRDTYMRYTEKDYKKINAAYQALGMQKMKAFLSEALGVKIHYSVVIDLDVISEVVDAVGGVDVVLPNDIDFINHDQGINVHLPAGKNHLNGKNAEYYIRYRSGYANADLGRMDAQKQFLQGVATAAQSMGVGEQIRLAVTLLPKTQTDLPLPKAIGLIRALSDADFSQMPMATAPGVPVRGTSGAWYYSLNRQKMLEAVNAYLLPQTPVTEEQFDPKLVFDRTDNEQFHQIYTSSGG